MNLVSQIFFAIIITTFTGTVAFGIWNLLQEFFLKWNPGLVYLTLRLVCVLYLLPIGYIIVQLTVKDGYIQSDGLWQLNFNVTGIMKVLFLLLVAVWIFLTGKCIVEEIRKGLNRIELYRGNIPEDDEVAVQEFARIKKKLKIHGNVRLYRNDMVAGPFTTGIFYCRVILPYREFSREQLRVIFYHELTHYKSHDVFYKWCSVYIGAIQHLNAFSKRLLELLNEWSEYDCDVKAVRAMEGEMKAGRYFETILDLMGIATPKQEEDYIFSMLCKSQSSLERRIEYMKKYAKINRVAKGVTSLIVFAFVMTSVTSAYAAGGKLADLHELLYKGTEQIIMEAESEAPQEYFIPAEEDNSYTGLVYANPELEEIMPLLEANEISDFNWSIDPGIRHVSNKIHLEPGQSIAVSCLATPANVGYFIGIMNSDGDVRYVAGSSTLGYDFPITEKDDYRVLVQNIGQRTITAAGNYYYHNPEEEATESTEAK